jgi:glycosyltransferase involved in cell wall biosynthesis
MKIVIPIIYFSIGGVERVIVSLITELSQQVEQIIIVASPKTIAHFRELLPESKAIIYESFSLFSNSIEAKILGILNKLLSLSRKTKINPLIQYFNQLRDNYSSKARLKQIINKYQATHCLYAMGNRINPPTINIPLAMISYDIFWHFATLTYSKSYIDKYDKCLLSWLQKGDIVITISEKTKKDILSLFPDFDSKIKAIPLAGFLSERQTYKRKKIKNNQPIFYYPSSFSVYKDQLTLLKAGLILAQKNLQFKIVLIGKETDKFIEGNFSLSQQKQTQEYLKYLDECNSIYQKNQDIIKHYFMGLGYCNNQEVEKWYKNCCCVVFPSRYEGFGLALSEAIVRGIPVIASDLEVFVEQVELYKCSDLVEFFPQGNADALSKSMEKFILNPQPKLSAQEIETRFSHWTWKDVAREYVKILGKCPSQN